MVKRAFVQWLLGGVYAQLAAMEGRIMGRLDDLKTQEDRVGSDIKKMLAQNTANLAALQSALENDADPDQLAALVDEAKSHADAIEAALSSGNSSGSSGNDTLTGGNAQGGANIDTTAGASVGAPAGSTPAPAPADTSSGGSSGSTVPGASS